MGSIKTLEGYREVRTSDTALGLLVLNIRNLIAGAVVSVWTITALASVITNNYTSLGAVTPVMMIVAGFLFGTRSSTPPQLPSKKREED